MALIIAGEANGLTVLGVVLLLGGICLLFSLDDWGDAPFFVIAFALLIVGGVLLATHWGS